VSTASGVPGDDAGQVDPVWGPVVERLKAAFVNEFELDEELGRGGMAAVFRARELALNRRVAIKVMAPGLLLGEGMVDRFRQEAITVANLQHANIVALHGVRTVGDLHLFVMQYIPGRSLDRILRDEGRLSFPAVRTIIYHVGSALDYAHRRGVVHRDIKPGNILLDGDGDPVVTDFGIAKVAETPGYTRVGTIIGTPTYMSPEQCMGFDVGPATDQYALGIVAYEMLTGRPPFGGTGMAMMRAHTEQAPAPVRDARADVPEPIEAAVMRMLEKKPADRFPDLAAAIEAFDAKPLGTLGPIRAEMSALAGAGTGERRIADIVRLPRSPAPASVAPSPPPAADSSQPTLRPEVASIRVDAPAEVRLGTRATLTARALDRRGAVVQSPVTWTSRNPAVASITHSGLLSPSSRGVAELVAEAGGVTRTVHVTVLGPPVVDVVIDGVPPVWVVGATVTLRAVVRTARTIDDNREHTVEWRSSDPAIAVVSADGVVTARAPGAAVITAHCEGIRGSATVTVVSVRAATVVIAAPPSPLRLGDRVTLKATVYDAAGKVVTRPISWRSTDARVAAVDQSGQVAAQAEGWAIVTAQADGVDSHAEIVVRQHVIPPSASGRRESRRLSLYWWVLLVVIAAVLAIGWRLLRR
jgi:hypothetical protein